MHQEKFIVDVLETIFSRGLVGPHALDVSEYLERTYDDDDLPEKEDFIDECARHFQLNYYSKNPELGITSTISGATHYWLAIHEAGHAIVGLKMEFLLTGVWFYREGTKGEAVLHNPDVPDSPEEKLAVVKQLIAVDVAGNMAQIVCGDCESPDGGLLSTLFDHEFAWDRKYPTDFIGANKNLAHVTAPIMPESDLALIKEIWRERKPMMEQAEVTAANILRDNLASVKRLASELMKGPMTGTSIKRIVDGIA